MVLKVVLNKWNLKKEINNTPAWKYYKFLIAVCVDINILIKKINNGCIFILNKWLL